MRLAFRQPDRGGRRHGVGRKLGFRVLQGPGLMMDFATQDLASVRGVETVALGEPVFERSFLAKADLGGWMISRSKLRWAAATMRYVLDFASDLAALHFCVEIGQVVESACSPDRRQFGRVEAEKIYAGLAAVGYIGADIEFRKAGKTEERRESVGANSAHVKGDNPGPGLAVEGVERELRWNERPHHGQRERPVGEEEIVPRLLHHPWSGG